MPLGSALFTASVGANFTMAPALGSGQVDMRTVASILLASGTGAGQADRIYTGTGSINASTTLSLDLSGSLLQADGTPFVLAKLKAIILRNTSTAQVLTLQRPASNGVPLFGAASGSSLVGPGGVFASCSPGAAGICTVTAGTGDLIDIVNPAGGTATYELLLAGTSA